ncbi:hypothetical protein EUX98_g6141 [Antrodiella citrinella]|uniref:Uncharacterized protein n=1 Tax=Antrodiella citrinella TaxID=2447956 RepID=A0A4S4MQP2_9APHY|nr:hypothetical protein EUX98_g6141 [Antrodiella citrinella]
MNDEPVSPGLSRAPWRSQEIRHQLQAGQQTLRLALLHAIESSEKLIRVKPAIRDDFDLYLLQYFQPEESDDQATQLAKFHEYADLCLSQNLLVERAFGEPTLTKDQYVEKISATLDVPTIILGTLSSHMGPQNDAYNYLDRLVQGTTYTLRLTGNRTLEASHMACLSCVDSTTEQPIRLAEIAVKYHLSTIPTDPFLRTPWIPRPEFEVDMEGSDVVYLLDCTTAVLVERSTGEQVAIFDVQLPQSS